MTWNYRLVKTVVDGEPFYAIHEAYYDIDDDKATHITENPVAARGDSIDDVKWALERMQAALEKPPLMFVNGKVVEGET